MNDKLLVLVIVMVNRAKETKENDGKHYIKSEALVAIALWLCAVSNFAATLFFEPTTTNFLAD